MSDHDPAATEPSANSESTAANSTADRSVTIPARPRRREQKPLGLSAAARATPPVAAQTTPSVPHSTAAEAAALTEAPARLPKHQRLSRRVFFIAEGQEDGLSELTKRLMHDPRRAAVPGAQRERISDSVLVRTAIDVLLRDHADALGCLTEDELRASVGLPPLGT